MVGKGAEPVKKGARWARFHPSSLNFCRPGKHNAVCARTFQGKGCFLVLNLLILHYRVTNDDLVYHDNPPFLREGNIRMHCPDTFRRLYETSLGLGLVKM